MPHVLRSETNRQVEVDCGQAPIVSAEDSPLNPLIKQVPENGGTDSPPQPLPLVERVAGHEVNRSDPGLERSPSCEGNRNDIGSIHNNPCPVLALRWRQVVSQPLVVPIPEFHSREHIDHTLLIAALQSAQVVSRGAAPRLATVVFRARTWSSIVALRVVVLILGYSSYAPSGLRRVAPLPILREIWHHHRGVATSHRLRR